MGNVIGKFVNPKQCVAKKSEVILVSNRAEDSISFNPLQSYAVAFCINHQTSPRFQHSPLDDTVVNDACKFLSALQENGVVPHENANLFKAKSDHDSCTFAGMKKAFMEQAKQVGKEGIFFFHFSGHGIKVSNDQYGLAPVDFDVTMNTYITATVLSQWLNEANCVARCVVFNIDCCYAGGLAEALTSPRDFHELTPFDRYVMAACTANETSFAVNTLQNTPYSYFLAHAIRKTESSPGHFPIKHIHEKCEKLTTALSSLLMSYDEVHGLVSKTMHPRFESLLGVEAGVAYGRAQLSLEGVRSEYILPLYEGGELPVLAEKCHVWLESTYKDLFKLQEEGLLHERCVLDTALCFMLLSVASIQLQFDSTIATTRTIVNTRNLYLTAYVHVVDTIHNAYSEAQFDLTNCIRGLTFYYSYLAQRRIDTQPLFQLYEEATRLENRHGGISAVPVSQLLLLFKNE